MIKASIQRIITCKFLCALLVKHTDIFKRINTNVVEDQSLHERKSQLFPMQEWGKVGKSHRERLAEPAEEARHVVKGTEVKYTLPQGRKGVREEEKNSRTTAGQIWKRVTQAPSTYLARRDWWRSSPSP